MNKNLHRQVVNPRRGQWIMASLCLPSVLSAQAQIIADRHAASNLQPTLLQTANGLPQVNIQTPSAAGVSRNHYSQFDVRSDGAILNNSRTNVQTQLGGMVQANPWLANGSAKIILNEINSSGPSYLNGYLEVAGNKADVVIANPAGINVNGAGFINVGRATLTTGTPIVNEGNLEGYRVRNGSIIIQGNGLNARSTDYTEILTRAMEINAAIWAKELHVATGTNDLAITANGTTVTPVAATTPAPRFAIDTALLGGMYAGKIFLIGTEEGVGVSNAGTLYASAGNVVLLNNGWLVNRGSLQASQEVTVSVDRLENTASGNILAQTTRIDASETLSNRGLIDGQNTEIKTGTLINSGTGRIYGSQLSIAAANLRNDSETVDGITRAGTIAARNTMDLAVSDTLTNREQALIYSAGDMTIAGNLDADRHATGSASTVNNSATIEAGGKLRMASANLNNTNEHLGYTLVTDAIVQKKDYVSTTGQTINQDEVDHITFEIGSVDAITFSGFTFRRPIGQLVLNDANASIVNFKVRRQYTETSTRPVVTQTAPGKILSGGDMTLAVSDTLVNDNSRILAGAALKIDSAHVDNRSEQVTTQTTRNGTTSEWGVIGEDCGLFGCDDVYGVRTGKYLTSIPVTVSLNQTQSTGNTVATQTNPAMLPNASLYNTIPDSSAPYLIETDARFTDNKRWLSSDYMLQALSLDPAAMQKKLGDGFYEQQHIREQLGQLTGRRFSANTHDDEQAYQALMDNGITHAKQWQLQPGIALTAEQAAQLTSDIVWLVEQTVTMPDGSAQNVLVPQLYVKLQPGDIDSDGAILSGAKIRMDVSEDLNNSGLIAGRQVVQLSADNVNNFGGRISADNTHLTAQQDINNIGGSIVAVDNLTVSAGRDLTLQTTLKNSGNRANKVQAVDRVAGLYVTGSASTLTASAGRDLNVKAGVIDNSGSGVTTLSAGNNINLQTVQTQDQTSISWNKKNYLKMGQTAEQGSQVTGSGDVHLNAGNDIHAKAAQVQATDQLQINAGRDIHITAGEKTQSLDQSFHAAGSGAFSSASVTVRNSSASSQAVASDFGGSTVTLTAGNDATLTGSNIIGDNDTRLTAANDLNLQAATNTSNQSADFRRRESGLMSSDGVGVSIGTRDLRTDQKAQTTTAAASTVGSINGDVHLFAGEQYRQTGSDVITPAGDVVVQAKTVRIEEARETSSEQMKTAFRQTGVTISISNPLLSAAQTIQTQTQAASQTSDGRMKALAAANIGLAANSAYLDVTAGQGTTINGKPNQIATGGKNPDGSIASRDANAVDKMGGITVSVSLGSSTSNSASNIQSNTARASTVMAGGDINIIASGNGNNSGLTVQGSTVSAGGKASLQAEGEINLVGTQNIHTEKSKQSSKSASVGVSVNTATGVGVNLSASYSRGKGNGSDVIITNTHINGATAELASGTDTNLVGAVVTAEQASVNTGGNLNIASLQDASTYHSKSESGGVSATIPIGPGSFGGSLSYSKTKVDSDYASVTEQSGIRAGDGGFQVDVQGNTNLNGGAVTSTQAAVVAGSNRFQTNGLLTTSDIENHASYDASSVSVTAGVAGAGQANKPLGSAGVGSQSDHDSSMTLAAISDVAGNTSARTGAAETGIAQIFDQAAVTTDVQAQVAITQETFRQISAGVYRADNSKSKVLLTRACATGATDCIPKVEIDLSKDIIYPTPDGKVFVFNNGIFNNEEEALKNAANHLGAAAMQGGAYTIVNPATGNPVSEVIFAGLDKAREITGLFGMSTASEVNIALRNLVAQQSRQSVENGGPPLTIVEVDHSRGSLTSSIATQEQIKAGQTNVPLGSVLFNGAAANAQRMADRVDIATSGQGTVMQATHPDDFVGTAIGGNEPQTGNSVFFTDAHSSYTGSLPPKINPDGTVNPARVISDKSWGIGSISQPVLVPPSIYKKAPQ